MVSKREVMDRLTSVIDPEIGLSIVEIGMVRHIEIEDRRVKVLIALTVPSCPLANTIKKDVEKAIMGLDGVREVQVEATSMTQEELEGLKKRLQKRFEEKGRAASGIERLDKKGIANIIAVVSGKGGVGKSFVSSMLAVELRRMGYEVGVLAADITGPSIAKIFNLTEKPRMGLNGILPLSTKSGIKAISINLLLDDPSQAVVWRGPIVSNVIKQLYSEVDWGELHYLIIDLPPGTSDAPLTVYQSIPIDGVVVVTTPQDLALMIVSKAINMAKVIRVPLLGLIENMGYLECPHCNQRIEVFGKSHSKEVAERFNIPFLGVIPIDPRIAELADRGMIEEYTNKAFSEVAENLTEAILKRMSVNLKPIGWRAKAGK